MSLTPRRNVVVAETHKLAKRNPYASDIPTADIQMFNKLIEQNSVPKKLKNKRNSMISIAQAKRVQASTQMHKFDIRFSEYECKRQSRPVRSGKAKQRANKKISVSGDNNVPDTIRNTTLSVRSVDTRHQHKATPGAN